jgi:phosphopantetheine--protein transferase-like protein
MDSTMEIRGIGVDVIEVHRIDRALTRWGETFTRRLFTADEVRRAGAAPARAMRLAGRFAAKEAVMKALGLGWRRMAWHEIEILNDEAGRPLVSLRGGAARTAQRLGISDVLISLTHTRDLAAASAIALG